MGERSSVSNVHTFPAVLFCFTILSFVSSSRLPKNEFVDAEIYRRNLLSNGLGMTPPMG
ncbi:hypothetical protein MKX03_035931, partial [Papaver bracteatum]